MGPGAASIAMRCRDQCEGETLRGRLSSPGPAEKSSPGPLEALPGFKGPSTVLEPRGCDRGKDALACWASFIWTWAGCRWSQLSRSIAARSQQQRKDGGEPMKTPREGAHTRLAEPRQSLGVFRRRLAGECRPVIKRNSPGFVRAYRCSIRGARRTPGSPRRVHPGAAAFASRAAAPEHCPCPEVLARPRALSSSSYMSVLLGTHGCSRAVARRDPLARIPNMSRGG
jgi:hypothetical protein